MVRLTLAFISIITVTFGLTACASDPRGTVITETMAGNLVGAVKDVKGLTVAETQLLLAYSERTTRGRTTGDVVPSPVGKTLGQLLEEEGRNSTLQPPTFITPSPASRLGPRKLLPTKINGRYGYSNRQGQLVIPAQFDMASAFFEGLAAVCVGPCKYKVVKKCRYTQSSSVELWEGKWGFIDESGKYVVNPQYDAVHVFIEGLAAVCLGEECEARIWDSGYKRKHAVKWGFIDRRGQVVIEPRYNAIMDFSDGLAGACLLDCTEEKKARWGYVDKNGEVVVNGQFNGVADFWDGIAMVVLGSGDDLRTGFIDRDGKYIVNPQ